MARAASRRPTHGAPAHRARAARGVIARLLEPAAVHRLALSGFVLVVAIFAVVRLLDLYPWNDRLFDQWAYWSTRFGFDYAAAHPGESGAYLYSPAFAQLIAPLTVLPLPVFMAAWTALVAAVFYWVAGWRAFFIGALAPVAMSIAIGQLDVLMAAAIVIGFRWPAAWVLPFITKVTPGIGVLWFAARGEWRSLGIALGATAAVVGASMAIDPRAWAGLARDARPIRVADRRERRLPAGPAVGPPAAGRAADRLGGTHGSALDPADRHDLRAPDRLGQHADDPRRDPAAHPARCRYAGGTLAAATRHAEALVLQRMRRRIRLAGLVLRREVATMVTRGLEPVQWLIRR